MCWKQRRRKWRTTFAQCIAYTHIKMYNGILCCNMYVCVVCSKQVVCCWIFRYRRGFDDDVDATATTRTVADDVCQFIFELWQMICLAPLEGRDSCNLMGREEQSMQIQYLFSHDDTGGWFSIGICTAETDRDMLPKTDRYNNIQLYCWSYQLYILVHF